MSTSTPITPADLLALDGAYLEIHCNNEPLTDAVKRQIKAVGGSYSECRGYANKRFVHVPVTALELANVVVRGHGYRIKGDLSCVIFRHPRTERYAAAVIVHDVPSAQAAVDSTARSINGHRARGFCSALVSNAEVAEDDAAQARSREAAEAARLAAALQAVDALSRESLAALLARHLPTDVLNTLVGAP